MSVFQPLFIVHKQTLMSFIYYKRSKKEKLQFWRKIFEGRCTQSDFRTPYETLAHPAKFWYTLRNFSTPCQILAHPAKFWHALRNFGTPCEIDDFALWNALFSSILLLIVLATKKLPKALKLTKIWLVTFARSLTCQLG